MKKIFEAYKIKLWLESKTQESENSVVMYYA